MTKKQALIGIGIFVGGMLLAGAIFQRSVDKKIDESTQPIEDAFGQALKTVKGWFS